MSCENKRIRVCHLATGLLALLLTGGAPGQAQPVLTQIRDVIYNADGSLFSGLVLIDWKSFETTNGAIIGQNSKVVQIVDGMLEVQLAPTTANNKTYYQARYVSRGRLRFTEIWAVQPANRSLKLNEVRAVLLPGGFVAAPTLTGNEGGSNGGGGGLVIGENNGGGFVDMETPAGLINGTNLVFTLTGTPTPESSLGLYRNGIRLSPGVDYTVSGNTITFVSGAQPMASDILRANYRTGAVGSSPHPLLSDVHSDSVAEPVQRGDLVVGQGSTAQWRRLPLGAANRCLVSNGQDAIWNTCLFTAFPSGAITFSGADGVLSQDTTTFFWDNGNKRLGLGTSAPSANLTVRASAGQGLSNLTAWLNASGTTVASVNAAGTLNAQRVVAASSTTTAGFNDSGPPNGADPSNRVTGDFWYNRSQRARKTFEANQVHSVPQVICSVGGGTTSSTTNAVLGSCNVPAEFFDSGDRIELAANFEHGGTASDFTVEIFIGNVSLFSRTFASTDTLAFVRGSGGYYPTGVALGTYSFGTAGSNAGSAFAGLSANTTLTPTAAAKIQFRGRLNTGGGDTLFLRNFSVIRYPAQFNP
jgi:hypothetical protein